MPRKPGTPNKITRTIREAILNSFEAIGGEAWLTKLAQDDPKTYAQLLARAVPTQVEGAGGGPVVINVVTGIPEPQPNDNA